MQNIVAKLRNEFETLKTKVDAAFESEVKAVEQHIEALEKTLGVPNPFAVDPAPEPPQTPTPPAA